jgi:hypothetical protein
MATTTNYGWTTPDDTALVKDGAAAIRTLGSSVDTTTKNLNPSTTLGDIEYRSSTANVNTRLGIGSTGNLLTVAGGVPTWAAPAAPGGLTLLQTVTLSGTSTTTSSFSTSYKNLVLQFYGVTTTINGQIGIRVNSNTGNNYGDAYLSDADTSFTINAGASYFRMLDYNVSGTNYSSGKIEFPEYANTSATTKSAIVHQTNIDARRTFNIAYIKETTAISTLTFLTATAATMGGTVLIYGAN